MGLYVKLERSNIMTSEGWKKLSKAQKKQQIKREEIHAGKALRAKGFIVKVIK